MTRRSIKVLVKLLLLLIVSPSWGLELTIDERAEIPLFMPLPTLLVQADAPHINEPSYWLKQDYNSAHYKQAILPGPDTSWHKIELVGNFKDTKTKEIERFLVVSSHTIQHLKFYLFEKDKLIQTQAIGLIDEHPAPVHYNFPYIRFQIKDGQQLTLLIQKNTQGRGLLPMTIYSPSKFEQVKRKQNIFWGAVIAVLLVMALYNALVYTLHPNLSYLWYLGFHTTAFMHITAQNGLGFWIWPDAMQVLLAQHIQLINFTLAFFVLNFSNVFLEAKLNAPWHYRFIPFLNICYVSGIFASLFFSEYTMMPFFTAVLVLGSIFGLSMGYVALKNKFSPARYFLLSWTFVFVGSVISMCAAANLLPANFFTMHSFLFGTLIELILLSVGLASRIKHMEQQLLTQSFIQPDTLSANFSYLKQQLPNHLSQLQKKHPHLAIIIANMTGFREIISLYGPDTLSQVYRHHTENMNTYLNAKSWAVPLPLLTEKSVYAVSLPGEQVLLLIATMENKLNEIIKELLIEAEKKIQILDIKTAIKYQLGYTFIKKDEPFQEAFRRAQIALLSAIQENKKQLSFNAQQDQDVAKRLTLVHELQEAIDQDQLQLYIQPQFSIDNEKLSGGEILLRWHHPSEGIIPPARFIVLAEQSGLIFTITKRVILKTCQWLSQLQKQAWKPSQEFHVSINLSALDLAEAELLPYLIQCIDQYQIPAQSLILEITESAAMNDPQQFLATIDMLKNAGFHISIDDFGTGYSSMQYLQTIKAHEIKIDLAFIRDLHCNSVNQSIVKAIIQLAHSTQSHTVAEGVECHEELVYLKTLNCRHAQGFNWSPAISLTEFEKTFLR